MGDHPIEVIFEVFFVFEEQLGFLFDTILGGPTFTSGSGCPTFFEEVLVGLEGVSGIPCGQFLDGIETAGH